MSDAGSRLQPPGPQRGAGNLLQFFRILATASSFVGFGLGGLLLSFVMPLVWLLGPRRTRHLRCARLAGVGYRMFHAYMRLTGLVDFVPQPHALPAQPCVVVANHPSLVDYPAIAATWPTLACVVKRGLFAHPMVGLLLRFCGHLPGASEDIESREDVILGAVSHLQAGRSVLVFPEGTRSTGSEVGPFQRLAFEIALRADVPIQPVAVVVDRPLLRKGHPWYGIPRICATMTLDPLPPVPPQGTPRSLRIAVREILASRVNGALR